MWCIFLILSFRAMASRFAEVSYGTCAAKTIALPSFVQRPGLNNWSLSWVTTLGLFSTTYFSFRGLFFTTSITLLRCRMRMWVVDRQFWRIWDINLVSSSHTQQDGIDFPLPRTRLSPQGRVWVRSMLTNIKTPPQRLLSQMLSWSHLQFSRPVKASAPRPWVDLRYFSHRNWLREARRAQGSRPWVRANFRSKIEISASQIPASTIDRTLAVSSPDRSPP